MKETAVFGGGCFWCTEAVFKMLNGVASLTSGYTGGSVANPTYSQVSSGTTGHAEAVEIVFDPAKVSYKDLLTVFFATHDATTLNRQGADVGTQYRSSIFYTNPEQKSDAEAFIKELDASTTDGDPIVTTVEPLDVFYSAEDYHQDYYAQNSVQGYCRVVYSAQTPESAGEVC